MAKSIKIFNKIEIFCMRFRYNHLLKGSKETLLGSQLAALFPAVIVYIFVYTLLLTGIISEFKPSVYMHSIFVLSGAFLTLYSFFNEVLYDSSDDMRNTVFRNTLGMFTGSFFIPKNPF